MLDDLLVECIILEKIKSKYFVYYKVIIEYDIYFIKTINGNNQDLKKLLINEVNKYQLFSNLDGISKMIKWNIDNSYYIIYKYIDGITLDKFVSSSYLEIVNILIDLCNILEKIHMKKIAHCDLKPENIMLDKNNKVFLLDYGTCSFFGEKCLYGSSRYCSLNQLKKEGVTPKFDIYSLGIIMFELFTGEKAFFGVNNDEMLFIKGNNILSICEIKVNLPIVVDEMLDKAINQNNNHSYCDIISFKDELFKLRTFFEK